MNDPLASTLFQAAVTVEEYTHYVDQDIKHAPGNRRAICGYLMGDKTTPATSGGDKNIICPECARIVAQSKGFYYL